LVSSRIFPLKRKTKQKKKNKKHQNNTFPLQKKKPALCPPAQASEASASEPQASASEPQARPPPPPYPLRGRIICEAAPRPRASVGGGVVDVSGKSGRRFFLVWCAEQEKIWENKKKSKSCAELPKIRKTKRKQRFALLRNTKKSIACARKKT
jgi:hypothetical protein